MGKKLYSWLFDLFMMPLEIFGLKRIRRKIIDFIEGDRILEVGVGTGLNIPYYTDDAKFFALDPNIGMLKVAMRRSAKYSRKVSLVNARVENLCFKSETFDTVFATLVFCEVKNPYDGLREIVRVLKPGGRIILLEHMRPENVFLGRIFDLVNLFTSRFGENFNRRTVEYINKIDDIKIEKIQNIFGDIVRLIIARRKN
jgi:ubiquinone/menaquinone biosynthesis C-methylase UbiE